MPRALILVLLGLVATGLGALSEVPEPRWTLTGPSSVAPGSTVTVTARVRLPEGYYQDAGSTFLIFEPVDGRTFPVTGRSQSAPGHRAGKSSYTGSFTLSRTITVPQESAGGPLVWRIGWQICQVDGVCLLPVEKTLTSAQPVEAPAPGPDLWAWVGWVAAAFTGGLVLNLMPCVFPVLALKALALSAARDRSPTDRRREAWAFAAGGWVTVFVLGVAAAGAALLGQRLNWGFTFQSPVFVGALALVFWVFALQLWGVWSWAWSPFALTGRTAGPGRAAAGGALVVLAAAPCTAPFLGPALGFAFSQPPAAIPLFFGAAGLGLVLPALVLSLNPGWTRWLPKPGPWMVTFERTAGFVLAGTVLYLLWVFTRQTSPEAVWPALAALGLVAGALAALGRSAGRRLVTAVLAIGAAVAALTALVAIPTRSDLPPGWRAFSPRVLSQALAEGRTVFVDGTAAWCATCQVNEVAVLNRPEVAAAFEARGILRLRADDTVPNPEVEAWLASLGRAGLPVYALYRPGKPVYLFPELLTGDFSSIMGRLETLP